MTVSHKTAVFQGRITGRSAGTQVTAVKLLLCDLKGEKQCGQDTTSEPFAYSLIHEYASLVA